MLSPRLHPLPSFRQTLGFVICGPYLVSLRMRQRQLNHIRQKPLLIEQGTRHSAKPMPCHLLLGIYTIRRREVFTVLFDIGGSNAGSEGNTNSPNPLGVFSSRRIATAWRDSGPTYRSFIFIRSPGIRHSAPSRSNSGHRAPRNSPGRTKISGGNLRAAAVMGCSLIPIDGPEQSTHLVGISERSVIRSHYRN